MNYIYNDFSVMNKILNRLQLSGFDCYILGTENNTELGCGQLVQNYICNENNKTINIGNDKVKGSIASWYLYKNYGYKYNGKRTTVYLEVKGYP